MLDTEGLRLKIDSKEAQRDLAALEQSLNTASSGATRMDRAFANVANQTTASLGKATKAMERYAQVAALLSKIKIAGNSSAQLRDFANALDALGRSKGITNAKVASVRELGAALQGLRMPSGILGVTSLLNSLGKAHYPSKAQITNLTQFFAALQTAKRIPSAVQIAHDLDMITAAATRAATALKGLPSTSRMGALTRAASGAGGGSGAGRNARSLANNAGAANRARSSFQLLGNGLTDLSGRFKLSYQAGTLLSTMFASFTIGTLVRGVYDANIQLLKLQKAMLFATGTFAGAEEATSAYIGISQKLGLSIKDNIETYGRFVIASTASGMKLKETNTIYESLATALTVVGASAIQQQLAFYGLTEMMQKGVVYSKEFNRQIGAQLPGNAVIGAQALTNLTGKFTSVSEFFKQMHSGTLQAATFIPEWAKAVHDMYAPLLSLAQQRPDIALTRLKNSFFLFAREIGNGKFMSAIGNEFHKLTGMLVEGEGANAHLTKGMQNLADTMGRNLAGAIHSVGSALQFLIDHLDGVIAAFKGLIAFKVAQEFSAIAAKALSAAAGVLTFAGSITKATVAGAANAFTPRVGSLPVGGTLSTAQSLANIRSNFATNQPRSIASRVGSGVVAAGGGLLSGLAAATSALGPIALATAVALAIVSDKMTGLKSASGSGITYGDLIKGTFNSITDSIGTFLKRMEDLTGHASTLSNKDVFGRFTRDLLAFGAVLVNFWPSMTLVIIDTLRAAGESVKNILSPTKQAAIKEQYRKDLKADLAPLYLSNQKKTILAGAGASATDRSTSVAENASQKQIEAAVQQQAAAKANMDAATLMNDAMAIFKEDTKELNFDDLMKRMDALASGDYQRTHAPRGVGAAFDGTVAPTAKTVAQAAAIAAPVAKLLDTASADNAGVVAGTHDMIFKTAKQHLGETEHNDKEALQGLFQVAGVNIDPEKVAWCAAFVNAVLASNGVATSHSLAASSFKNYGEAVTTPHQGDIVVLKPQGKDSSGHVGFFQGFNANGSVQVLGGNQGNAVGVSNFKSSDVVGYRRPTTIGTATPQAAALNAQAALSSPQQDVAGPSLNANGTESEADKLAKKLSQDYKQFEALTAAANPSAAALAREQERLVTLSAIITSDEERARLVGKDYKSPIFTPGQLEKAKAAEAREQHTINDMLNPIGKLNRLNEQAYEISKLRASGMEDEAKYQAELYKLLNEGEDVKARALESDHKQFLLNEQLNRGLEARANLQKELNDIEAAKFARTSNNSFDIGLNQRVTAYANAHNMTTDQARAAMIQDGSMDAARRGVSAGLAERTAAVQQSGREFLAEGSANTGLNPMQRTLREDFKRSLQEQTGLQTESLARLEAEASKDQLAFAASFAKTKQEIENPPGLQRWVDSLEPFSKRLEDIKANFVEGLSTDITEALTGNKQVKWGDLIKDARKQLIKGQVDNLLKNFLTGTGLAKETPEDKILSGAKTFDTATDKFSDSVDRLTGTTGGGSTSAPVSGFNAEGSDSTSLNDIIDLGGGTASLASPAGFGGDSSDSGFGFFDSVLAFGSKLLSKVFGGNNQAATANGIGQGKAAPANEIMHAATTFDTATNKFSDTVDRLIGAVASAQSFADSAGMNAGSNSGYTGTGSGSGSSVGDIIDLGGGTASLASPAGFGGGGSTDFMNSTLPSDFLTQGTDLMSGLTNMSGGLSGFNADGSAGPSTYIPQGGPEQVTVTGGAMPTTGTGRLNVGRGGSATANSGADDLLNLGLMLLPSLFHHKKKPVLNQEPSASSIIGQMSTNSVSGWTKPAHDNVIGDLLQGVVLLATGNPAGVGKLTSGLNAATGGNSNGGGIMSMFQNMMGGGGGGGGGGIMNMFGGGGGNQGSIIDLGGGSASLNSPAGFSSGGGLGDMFSSIGDSFMSMFEQGGYTDHPLAFASMPQYAHGTANTSGFPAILHPNEAVIPLSGGRKIPIEGGANNQPVHVQSNITVIAPDPDAFRQSQGSIARQQNRTMRRAALRNLTHAAT